MARKTDSNSRGGRAPASTPASHASEQFACCCFDLETSDLDAHFGIVLCGVIKPAGRRPEVFRADDYPPWQDGRRSDDSCLVADIIGSLARYDIWIGHNARRFDVPFLRLRALRWGLEPVPDRKLFDPFQLARNKLTAGRWSLEALAKLTGSNSKTDIDGETWKRAALDGDKSAMDDVVRHCVEDVKTLGRLSSLIKPYCTQLNSWGSAH